MLEKLLYVVLGAVGVYFAVDLLVFRRLAKRPLYRTRLQNALLLVAIVVGLLLAIREMTLYLFLQIVFLNIVEMCVLVLATTGIVLIFKTSVTTNFAQGTIATVGAYAAAKLIIRLTAETDLPTTTKLILAMIASAVVTFLIGLFIDTVIFRNSKYSNPVGKQMITMGIVLVLFGLMPVLFGLLPLTIEAFSYEGRIIEIPGMMPLYLPYHNLIALAITVGMLVLLFAALRFTKWGLGVRATASNETVAGMMGVNTKVITALSWAIAGTFGGVAAFLFAPIGSGLSVAFMTPVQVNAFLASILGGFSTFGGPLVGAVMINLFSSIASAINSVWTNVIVYVLVLLLVLVKPLGLFGRKTAKKV
ncbi:MAG: branched-chain amino acid ABC transporter permease [Candidatus Izemoplasmatales bacterium]